LSVAVVHKNRPRSLTQIIVNL